MSLLWQQSFGKGLPCPPQQLARGLTLVQVAGTNPKPLQQRASPPASISPSAYIHCGASNLGTSA